MTATRSPSPWTPRPWTPADVVSTVVALAITALGAGAGLVLAVWLVAGVVAR